MTSLLSAAPDTLIETLRALGGRGYVVTQGGKLRASAPGLEPLAEMLRKDDREHKKSKWGDTAWIMVHHTQSRGNSKRRSSSSNSSSKSNKHSRHNSAAAASKTGPPTRNARKKSSNQQNSTPLGPMTKQSKGGISDAKAKANVRVQCVVVVVVVVVIVILLRILPICVVIENK
mgnify:CR=1 FL=1